jgi:signal peptidase I
MSTAGAPPSAPAPPTGGPLARSIRLLKAVAVPLAVFLLLRTFVLEAFHIWPSGSMERTLLIGDFLFVNKALYGAEIPVVHRRLPGLRDPELLDVIVFKSVDDPRLTVVKRIIGTPGDTLAMRANQLYRNGILADEPYVVRSGAADEDVFDPRMRAWQLSHYTGPDPRTYRPTLKNWGPIVVPPDSFFVMGDNRDDSYDSRYWGLLGRDRIRGSPFLVYFSYDRNGRLPLPFVTAIRWDRLFTVPH